MHPGKHQPPFFDSIDMAEIDLVLVTHFHLDHCAALPSVFKLKGFRAKVYMTQPTKVIYKLLLNDSLKFGNSEKVVGQDCTEEDIKRALDETRIIDFHQEFEENGIKFTCYKAGHVIGAAMFLVEIDGVKILYTGDYSREEDRHLTPAEIPKTNVDVLIVESTYGTNRHEARVDRETKFCKSVEKIVLNGGSCLLPVFAVGRAQELLLILDEYWEKNKDLQNIPIYYASTLAAKCMSVFRFNVRPQYREKFKTPGELNRGDHDRHRGGGHDPRNERGSISKYISILENMDSFNDEEVSVVMSAPGMLQSGNSLKLFKKWCCSEKNGVIITGYCVENTLAKDLLNEQPKIVIEGKEYERKIQVIQVSFSAHADFDQTKDYISKLKPKHVVLVHGGEAPIRNLQIALRSEFPSIETCAPKNNQEIILKVRKNLTCDILGELSDMIEEKIAEVQQKNEGAMDIEMGKEYEEVEIDVEGSLCKKNAQFILGESQDLKNVLQTPQKSIIQKLNVQCLPKLDTICRFITKIYPDTTLTNEASGPVVRVKGINLTYSQFAKMLQFEWVSSTRLDIIVDTLAYFISNLPELAAPIDDSPAGLEKIVNTLKVNFPDSRYQDGVMTIENGDQAVYIDLNSMVHLSSSTLSLNLTENIGNRIERRENHERNHRSNSNGLQRSWNTGITTP